MYCKGNQMVKKLTYGEKEVKAVYVGDKKIYPNITGQKNGYDYGDWIYNLPDRSRTVKPWTQYEYADGSLGEKLFGTTTTESEAATVSERYSEWTYTITTASGVRSRIVYEDYVFSDETKTITKTDESEAGTRSVGSWSFDWINSVRTGIVTYKFTDETKTIPISETGTVNYGWSLTPNSRDIVPASGGTITFNTKIQVVRIWNSSMVGSESVTLKSIKFTESTAPTGFTIVSAANGVLAVSSRGTTAGYSRSASIYGTIEIDNKTLESNPVTITQEANVALGFSKSLKINGSPTASFSCPKAGGTYTLPISIIYGTLYTSGAVDGNESSITNFNSNITLGYFTSTAPLSANLSGTNLIITIYNNSTSSTRQMSVKLTLTHKTNKDQLSSTVGIYQN